MAVNDYTYFTRYETGAIYRTRDGGWEVKNARGRWEGVEEMSEQTWDELERIDAVEAGEASADLHPKAHRR